MPTNVKLDDIALPDPLATLAKSLAERRGLSVGDALTCAVKEALAREDVPPRHQLGEEAVLAEVRAIIARAAANRQTDNRPDDDILGYPDMFPDQYRTS